MAATRGPRFVRYLQPVIAALRALGGSARPAEVVDRVAADLSIGDAERGEVMSGGGTRFTNQVAWARFYLSKAGYIDSSRRGVWVLTDKGQNSKPLSSSDALAVFKAVQSGMPSKREGTAEGASDGDESTEPEGTPDDPLETGHRERVLQRLRTLPPAGFERFCQRLLRESGFLKVDVTGRSGDEGIDGIGVFQVNPFVSFKVLFQCKRYAKSVGAGHVRDFRGAMAGRADKGIILTTGYFTTDAQREGVRDGVVAIELVDGAKLIEMLEALELGLSPIAAYAINDAFFDDFADDASTTTTPSKPRR